jgi:hypothetical protein
MYCGYCGAENEDGAKFCKSCGKELASSNAKAPKNDTSNNTNNGTTATTAQTSQIVEKIKALPKNTLIGICAGIVALIVIIIAAVNAKPTINMNKYITVEADGYDGYGSARVQVDWDAIEEKYGDKIKFTNKAKKEGGNLLNLFTPYDYLADNVSVKLEKNDKLSNGETIEYKWNVEEDLSDYLKVKVKYKDDSYTVEGLTEVGKFNPFDSLEVSFVGISPNGQIDYEYSGSELSTYDFKCDKMSGLRNGDKVKISISDKDMSYYAERFGKIPDTTSKEYEVSGLEEYISEYASLTDEFISTCKKEAEDSIYAYTAKSYNTESSLTDLKYAGYILNAVKDGDGYYNSYNNLYIIYKGTVSNSEGRFSTATVYFPVRFSNILKSDSGLSFGSVEGIVGNSNFDRGWYSTRGYINPLTCYMEIVEANRDSYTAECGDGFEVYSEYENVTKLDDISESYIETLSAEAKDTIESYVADSYNNSTASDLKLAGEYLLLAKTQGTDFANNNKLFIVYSATVTNDNGRFDPTTVYYPVEYDGIVKLPGDEYMFTAAKGIVGHSNFGDTWYYTDGYTDGGDMYSEIVTSNRNNYSYEVSDGLKEFGD